MATQNSYGSRTNPFTCGGCPGTWTGTVMAHCPTCHRTFGSVNSFTRHRVEGICHTPWSLGLTWIPSRHCWSEPWSTERVDDTESRTETLETQP